MKIGFIGYRNHAKRLMALVDQLAFRKEFIIYYPDSRKLSASFSGEGLKAKIELTSVLRPLYDTDVVFIASPARTHFHYLDLLRKNFKGYIFCEKPPCSNLKELNALAAFNPRFKSRCLFNFCFRHSLFSKACFSAIKSGKHGTPISLSFRNSHGLAFKESFSSNWRNTSRGVLENILGNLGIHYVDLTAHLLGKVKNITAHSVKISGRTRHKDSVILIIETGSALPTTIFLSYACPHEDSAKLVLSDGIIELDNGVLSLRRPRDTFDKSGLFAPPPADVIATFANARSYYDDAIKGSISDFFKVIKASSGIPLSNFASSINSTRLLLVNKGN